MEGKLACYTKDFKLAGAPRRILFNGVPILELELPWARSLRGYDDACLFCSLVCASVLTVLGGLGSTVSHMQDLDLKFA